MSISTTTNRVSTAGDGTATVFSYPYLFLANGDLKVILRVDSTGAETVQTITTHYTVTGAEASSGGFVTMVTAPASGETLIIYNDPGVTQGVNLVENDSLPAETLERALDRVTLISQRQADRLDRSITLSEGFNDTFDLSLPDLLTASSVFGVNAAADGFEMGPTFTEISNAETYATAASTAETNASASATAAASSETNASTSETNASTAATNASTAETNSSQSETDASTAETNSSQSETDASTAATNASTAETNSSQSETDASTAETNASTAATNASTAETNSSQSETDASTAETNASTAATNASTAETNASASETAAANSAAAAAWNDVNYKATADSPITIADSDNGELYIIDCTSGNVTVNLPAISALTLNAEGSGWKVAFKKSDSSANTITINRSGSDTIEGDTSKVISFDEAYAVLVADDTTTPDKWAYLEVGNAAAGGGSIEIEKEETTHGFSVHMPIYHDGTNWQKAKADDAETLGDFVVTEVVDADNFKAAKFMELTETSHGLTVGQYYFTDASTAGAVTSSEPSDYSNPLFYVEDADTLHVMVHRPSATAEVSKNSCKITREETSGTHSGASTSGSWATKTLNTISGDYSAMGISLASNVITIPAGTYRIWGHSVFYGNDYAAIRLQNTDDATTIFTSVNCNDAYGKNPFFKGEFTLAAEKDFELQGRVTTSQATYGHGVAQSYGTEYYSSIYIEEV